MLLRYSMIESYLQCPKKYKNLYIDNRGSEKNSVNLHFGSAMHAALNAHFDEGDPNLAFNLYWETIKETPEMEYDRKYQNWDEAWEHHKWMATEKFIPNFIRLHAKHFNKPLMEQTISAPICNGEHTLQGTFDVCAEVHGELTMIDYKTSASRYQKSKLQRNPQLYIYSWLYLQRYKVMPQSIMYKVFVKSDQSIQTEYLSLTPDKLENMMQNVESIIRDMTSRSNWFCNHSCYCLWPEECFK